MQRTALKHQRKLSLGEPEGVMLSAIFYSFLTTTTLLSILQLSSFPKISYGLRLSIDYLGLLKSEAPSLFET